MRRLFLSTLAVLALAGPAFAASVDGPTQTTSVAARTAGLDLGHHADAQRMVARLDHAALSVCGASQFSASDYRNAVRRSDCYRDAMNTALASLNAPTVTAVYRERAVYAAR